MKYLTDMVEALSFGRLGSVEDLVISGVLNSMNDSLMVIGPDGEVLYANRATTDILGYSVHDFRSTGIEALLSRDGENREINEIFSEVIRKKCAGDRKEVMYRHPNGEMKRLAATTSYLLAEGQYESVLVGFVLMFKDVTEVFNLRSKEQELLLEKQRVEREKARSLHRLAMGVAHEIRNPVVTIGGFAARIMRDHRNSEDARHQAELIVEDAGKLERLVDHVQQYCDLPELNPIDGDILQPVRAAVQRVMQRAEAKRIQLAILDNLDGHRCMFDAALIERALVELLDNAIDFSPEGSTVRISVRGHGEETVLEVADPGEGIPPQYLDYIFDPFFSTRTESSGMGLAIVERIVHEHMGRIDVETRPGKGTSIRIAFSGCIRHLSD
ncbi:MAG: ATP-binding protein [Desulfomonilaceae bacterium]|nr:ATP-binding protein [Desulfomonilaceae bacterium]